MSKRFFEVIGVSLLGVAMVLGLVGGAAATPIQPGMTAETFNNQSELYLSVSGLNNLTPDPNPFIHVYTFDVTSDTNISVLYDVIIEPPVSGDPDNGIADMTFVWANSLSGIVQTNVLTDASGLSIVSGIPVSFFFNLLAGSSLYTLTVTGTQLAEGGDYSFRLETVPLPGAALLFGSVLLGGGLLRRRKMIKEFGLPA